MKMPLFTNESNIHFMLDIETLGLEPTTAPIIQIACVAFCPVDRTLRRELNLHLDIEKNTELGRLIEASTIRWWLDTNPHLFKRLVGGEGAHRIGMHPTAAVGTLFNWMLQTKLLWNKNTVVVWAKSVMFDIAAIKSFAGDMKLPWHYYNVHEARTVYAMAGEKPKLDPYIAHNALADAVAQTNCLLRCYDLLANAGTVESHNV